eukprot:IDg21656t1
MQASSDASATHANQHVDVFHRSERHQPKTQFAKDIVLYVKAVLEEICPDDADSHEILEGIRESFPTPRMILNSELFGAPLFSVAILKYVPLLQ